MLLQRCYFCHAPLVHTPGNGGVDWDSEVCQGCWDEIQELDMATRAALLNEWHRTKAITGLITTVTEKLGDYGIPKEQGW